MNLDSTQSIMDLTVIEEGMLRFYHNGGVLIEAPHPGEMRGGAVEEWCNYVRSAVSSLRPSDSELAARRQRNREYGNLDTESSSDPVCNDPADDTSPSNLGDIGTTAVRTFEDDPEAFAIERWEHYCRRATVLAEELKETVKLSRKWEAIAAAAQQVEED